MKNLKSKIFLFVTALLLAASLSQFTASTAKAASVIPTESVSGNGLEPLCDKAPKNDEDY